MSTLLIFALVLFIIVVPQLEAAVCEVRTRYDGMPADTEDEAVLQDRYARCVARCFPSIEAN